MPERLDYQLKPGVAFADAGEPIPVSLDARFLYGAPAAGLDVTGAIRLQGGRRLGAAGPSRLCRRPRRRRVRSRRGAVPRQGPDRRQGPRRSLDRSARGRRGQAAGGASIIVDVAESGGRTVERVVTLPVRAKAAMIGVKKDFDEISRARRERDLRGDRGRRRTARRSRARASPGRSTSSTTTTNGSTPTAAGTTSRSNRRASSPTA